jgi:hypothetical protein
MPVDADVTRWSAYDDSVLAKAKELAAKLRGASYYTDTQTMAIRCEVSASCISPAVAKL